MSTQRTKPPKPKILPRSSWHARSGGGLIYDRPLPEVYYRATLHHDAAPAPSSLEDSLAMVKRHQETHFGMGWSDIGYHYFVAPDGSIVEGRPLNTQGSHVYMENWGNVGICVMGQLHLHQATKWQLASLKQLYAWLCWELDLQSDCLRGHQDYLPTQCPGSLQAKIPEVRQFAKRALTNGQALPIPPEPKQPPRPSLVVDGSRVGDLQIIDGESFIPVRALATALGWQTDWEAETKTVSLRTNAS